MKLQMNAQHLIQCIAGDLLADPSEIFELIKEDDELLQVVRNYLAGTTDYETVMDTVSEYC